MDIGKRIRQLRVQNDLTLEELASRTELTKGFLSQLERNLASPSIATLEDIAEALGVSMAEFFASQEEEQVVFTENDAFVDERDNETIHWIVPNAQKNAMEPVIIDLLPHQETDPMEPHNGEEFGYVLSGKVALVWGGNKKGRILHKGDNFYMPGKYRYCLANRWDKPATILWVSTPPAF